MARFKTCRVTYQGQRYQINADGSVFAGRTIEEPVTDGRAMPTGEIMRTRLFDVRVSDETLVAAIRADAGRQRRNRSARERNQAMRDLGIVRTPYGWE
jgi:hypothetical protein